MVCKFSQRKIRYDELNSVKTFLITFFRKSYRMFSTKNMFFSLSINNKQNFNESLQLANKVIEEVKTACMKATSENGSSPPLRMLR